MSKKKLSEEAYIILDANLKEVCPMCQKDMGAMHVYRSSKKSVTLRCKRCSFRFTSTWKSIADSFEALRKLYKAKGDDRKAQYYKNGIDILSVATITEGTHRYNKWASRAVEK